MATIGDVGRDEDISLLEELADTGDAYIRKSARSAVTRLRKRLDTRRTGIPVSLAAGAAT